MMKNNEVIRKKYEVKRKVIKTTKVNEKSENLTPIRAIMEKWRSMESKNKKKDQVESSQSRGEKRKYIFLTNNERGAKSVSESSLGKVENRSMTGQKHEKVTVKKSKLRHYSEGNENSKDFLKNVQKIEKSRILSESGQDQKSVQKEKFLREKIKIWEKFLRQGGPGEENGGLL